MDAKEVAMSIRGGQLPTSIDTRRRGIGNSLADLA